jgi:hypothetical protein
MNYKETFIKEIIALSESNNFYQAVLEWKLISIFDMENNCLCGHPIIENCEIQNIYNDNIVIVGNCCIKKFIKNINSGILFSSVKRLSKNGTKSVNTSLLDLMYENEVINAWELFFYKDIIRKRNLSPKQQAKKVQINNKIIKYINRKKQVFQFS